MKIEKRTKKMTMVRGDSEMIRVRRPEQPYDTGDVVQFTVRKRPNTERLIHKTVTEFVDGDAYIEIDPADTSDLKAGTYCYDIQHTSETGWVTTIIWPSEFAIVDEVTYDG